MAHRELRAYLLGQLPGSDVVRLEERLLEDQEFFVTVKGVEDDLFDEHARHALTRSDREHFLRRFGTESSRLGFARALAARTAPVTAGALGEAPGVHAAVRFVTSRWVGLAAAAALVLVVGRVLLTPVREPNHAVRAPEVVASAPANQPLSPGGLSVVATVTLGTTRSAGAPSKIALAAGASTLRLRVRLDPADRFDIYSMELRSTSNRVVWRGDHLRALTEGGDLVLGVAVPARSIVAGSYELAVRGSGTGDGIEDMGFVSLEVRRPQ